MSWTQVLDGYQPFKTSAAGATLPGVLPGPSQFLVTIWEVKESKQAIPSLAVLCIMLTL
jgi:hypothetical protein